MLVMLYSSQYQQIRPTALTQQVQYLQIAPLISRLKSLVAVTQAAQNGYLRFNLVCQIQCCRHILQLPTARKLISEV
ncbi:MAG: hypothetical protein EBU13_10925 [Synechococcaceae bacterium WB5_2A_257]|nr:hypothetical protein [Synechococcaceae bacterium WB5_2A_257]